MKLLDSIFSVKNEYEHKIFNICGIKLKFRNLFQTLSQQEETLISMDRKLIDITNQTKDFSKHLQAIEKFCNNFNNKKAWGLIDSVNGSFCKYFIENNMPEKIRLFKKNLDTESIKLTEVILDKMLRLPDENVAKLCNLNIDSYKLKYDSEFDKKYENLLLQHAASIKSQYKLSRPNYDMEVFLYHHGLKYANQQIKDYVKNKDFIDAGAYIGDSALVLTEYEPRCIHSFEISKNHCENYIETMQINNIDKNLYRLNNIGLADGINSVKLNNNGDMGKKIYNGNGEEVQLITLDDYTLKHKLNVGFIKADIEGAMYLALQGMRKTIINNRPILSLAIYHSAEEFFDTKILLDEICKDLNYSINIDSHFSESMHIYGTILWAYPKELSVETRMAVESNPSI